MQNHYGQYFQRMPCYLSIHDKDYRIVDGNERFRRDFGERIGEFCYEVYKQRQEKCPNCPVEMTFADGESHESEQLLITQNGRQVPVMVHTTPFADEQGGIESVMEMHTDITEAKRLHDQLQRSQRRFFRLFEEVPCFITVQGPDLKIQNANRKFRETFGESAVGDHCYRVYKHRDEPCLVCNARETMEDGVSRSHEEVVTAASGDELHVLCTTASLLDGEGRPEAFIEMSHDITKMRELQTQLASIGLLVGSISHGIKGLLTGLDGGIYLVESGFRKNDQPRVEKGWDMVLRNVGRIRSMVMDILYYAKDRELSLSDIDPGAMIGEMEGDLDKKASDIGLELTIDVPKDTGTFPADAMATRAMLMNLIENSFDACRADKKKKKSHFVKIMVRREPPYMIFDVEDNGIGMDRETRGKIFSLFFSSKGIKGTGLGLFIANKIVDKHGGRIDVDSEPDRGTRFLVQFPLEPRPSVPLVRDSIF